MQQQVLVKEVYPDGTAQVLHLRQSACSGDCHKCSGCGAVSQKMLLTARNPIGAQPGDLVVIQSASGPVLAGAAVLYLMPLVLFFLGYALGSALGIAGGMTGCAAFLLGIVLAAVYDKLVAKKQKTVYTITGWGQAVPRAWENEDSSLD